MNIVWTALARTDLTVALRYYQDDDASEMAFALLQAAENAAAALGTFPETGALLQKKSGVRRKVLSPLPFALYYQVTGAAEVHILRFRHTARRPLRGFR